MDLRWKHPFTAIVAGPTSCGKSFFVAQLLNSLSSMSDVKFNSVIWCYSVWQPLYSDVKLKLDVTFNKGMLDIEDGEALAGFRPPRLIIVDDLMRESDQKLADMFTKDSHHRSVSVIYITQNLFHKGRWNRDISLNTHYIVAFKNPRDRAQFSHLSRQVCPQNTRFLEEAYQEATKRPHGYLLLDLKQSTDDSLRYRTNILPGERCLIFKEK